MLKRCSKCGLEKEIIAESARIISGNPTEMLKLCEFCSIPITIKRKWRWWPWPFRYEIAEWSKDMTWNEVRFNGLTP